EDRDYEQRVGRFSGKSLLNSPQIQGVDDQKVTVVDDVPEGSQVGEVRSKDEWFNSLELNKQTQLKMQGAMIDMNEKRIKADYQNIGDELNGMRSGYRIEMAFQEILKQNKELDKKYQDFLKTIKSYGVPSCELPDLYKAILNFYTEQNQGLSRFYGAYGHYTKSARKTQQYVNAQIERYVKYMEKSLQ
ncbi:MAG: hypothetical protein IJS08_16120, partial [Victivallales bacterium]|nr:hypothetical protein [Victivallales bacterium]